MRATEFCYWLQGAFELGDLKAFSESAIKCISKHLELVRATNQTGQPAEVTAFCGWLDAVMFVMTAADQAQATKIRERLAGLFEHTIDKLYPNGDQLNEIHSGPPRIPSQPGMRC